MAGDVVMGICYVCEKEVTDEDFSRVGYQMYKNVVHAGDCFNTFKKKVQEHKTKKKTDQLYDIADEIKGLRKDLRELIDLVKAEKLERDKERVSEATKVKVDLSSAKSYFESKKREAGI